MCIASSTVTAHSSRLETSRSVGGRTRTTTCEIRMTELQALMDVCFRALVTRYCDFDLVHIRDGMSCKDIWTSICISGKGLVDMLSIVRSCMQTNESSLPV